MTLKATTEICCHYCHVITYLFWQLPWCNENALHCKVVLMCAHMCAGERKIPKIGSDSSDSRYNTMKYHDYIVITYISLVVTSNDK